MSRAGADGAQRTGPTILVVSGEKGERDLVLEEIKARARHLMGGFQANIFVVTEAGFPKPFVIGRFENPLDTRPEIYRDWRLFGAGDSWAEALARAEMALHAGAKPPLIRGRQMRGGG